MNYSDSHIHISLKHYVTNRKDLWARETLKSYEVDQIAAAETFDQADVTSLNEGNVKIAIAALHPLEKVALEKGLNRLITKEISEFSLNDLKCLYEGGKSYFDILNEEYNYILKSDFSNNNNSFLLVENKDDLLLENETKIVLSIEGGHALHGNISPQNRQSFGKEVLNNLDKIKDWKHPVFCINLAHFAQNEICGQAWAIPIPGIFKSLANFKDLKSESNKISSLGFEVIKKSITPSGLYNRKILIDIKHMHIESRYQYYEFIKDQDSYKVPIIAGHIGVSGRKNKEKALEVKDNNWEPKCAKYQKFNPWSLNLNDEELKIIYDSKGIIGISLDERILGSTNDEFCRKLIKRLKKAGIKKVRKYKKWHTLLFVENLFHIVKAIGTTNAWNHICIGSDFDGIINPINQCPTSLHFEEFEKDIINNIEIYYPDYKIYLPAGETIDSCLRKVFYENLTQFIINNFQSNVIPDEKDETLQA